MSDGIEQANATQDQELRLRAGMRCLAWGSVIALVSLIAWAIFAAMNGSTAGMVAASSGSVAVAVAWGSGYLAIKTRLEQIAASADDTQ